MSPPLNVTTTNLSATNAFIDTLGVTTFSASSGTITNFLFANATGTNLFVTNFNAGTGSINNFTSNSSTITNLFSPSATFTSSTIVNLTATTATITNLVLGSPLNLTNITWVNATGTNTTSTNLFATTFGFTNATGDSLTSNIANINTLTSVNGSITTLTSTSGTITTFNFENATGSSLYANTIQATTVSSTAMFVNGVAVCLASGTNCPTGTTPNLQTVTNAGNTTTNAIQFAGGTSTADFVFNTSCDGQRRLHGQWREQSPERFLLECHGFQPLRLASHGYQWHDRYPCFDQWHHHFLVGYLGHDHQPFAASTTVTGTLTANNATASTLASQYRHLRHRNRLGPGHLFIQWRWLSECCELKRHLGLGDQPRSLCDFKRHLVWRPHGFRPHGHGYDLSPEHHHQQWHDHQLRRDGLRQLGPCSGR
jgi:hypothetical protein